MRRKQHINKGMAYLSTNQSNVNAEINQLGKKIK
jgi:hypothetical protein